MLEKVLGDGQSNVAMASNCFSDVHFRQQENGFEIDESRVSKSSSSVVENLMKA